MPIVTPLEVIQAQADTIARLLSTDVPAFSVDAVVVAVTQGDLSLLADPLLVEAAKALRTARERHPANEPGSVRDTFVRLLTGRG